MTAADLRQAEVAYRAAAQRAERLRETRNAAVLAALADGWTHAAVAVATGLTRGRVGQIAQTAPNASRRLEERLDELEALAADQDRRLTA